MHTVNFILILFGLGIIATVYTGLSLLVVRFLPRIVLWFAFLPIQFYVYCAYVAFLVYVTKDVLQNPKRWATGLWLTAFLMAVIPLFQIFAEKRKVFPTLRLGRKSVNSAYGLLLFAPTLFAFLFCLPIASIGRAWGWKWMGYAAAPVARLRIAVDYPDFTPKAQIVNTETEVKLLTDTAASYSKVDPELQSLYAELRRRGALKYNPETEKLMKEGMRRGLIHDPDTPRNFDSGKQHTYEQLRALGALDDPEIKAITQELLKQGVIYGSSKRKKDSLFHPDAQDAYETLKELGEIDKNPQLHKKAKALIKLGVLHEVQEDTTVWVNFETGTFLHSGEMAMAQHVAVNI